MRIVEPADNDVGTTAHAGGNRRLGADIFPACVVYTNFNTGLLRAFLGVGRPEILVALHEAVPPKPGPIGLRPEDRRVGKERVTTWRYGRLLYNYTKETLLKYDV